ncbi:MAG: FAD-binding protein [candidate division KSB1 bacterium]|nr:FAD-binding protein [candidate division KSB1 bacterium]MDZ7305271.1 FAD-binding protein [candidate division KSB1 bacterium]MDZ7313831.1 FAD-binding protein [candidate division KSB1 bacterium]
MTRSDALQNSYLLKKLSEIVGAENVFASIEDRLAYAYDATPMLETAPLAAVRPVSVEHVQALLHLANSEGFAVIPRGAGTGLSGGSIPVERSLVLLFPSWNRILEIDQENLTAWVEPGVIAADLHAAVEAAGLFYPPDPGSMKVCTIGGTVAENSGGLRGLKYGVTKDYVMGLEVILPTGELLRVGNKCVKDVAGFSFKELFIGSEGTLGIFTKILLQLIPRPATSKTLLALYDDMQKAAATVSAIIAARIIPCTLEFLDATTIRCVEDFAHVGFPTDTEALLLIEVDGHPAAVADEFEKVQVLCRKQGAREIQIAKDAAEADKLKTARRSAFSALARVRPTTILEDVTVPRSQVATMLQKIRDVGKKYKVTFGNFGHFGDGNLHPTCLTDERDHDEIHRVEKAFEEVFQIAIDLGGTITGEHGVGLSKKKFLEKVAGPAGVELMRKIKHVLDPNNILNPGKIFDAKPRCEAF